MKQPGALLFNEGKTFGRRPVLWSIGLLCGSAGVCFAGEGEIVLPRFGRGEMIILGVVFVSAICALLYGLGLVKKVNAVSPGSEAMQKVGAAIQEGAMAYLGRQFRTMIWLVIALGV